MPGIGAIQVDFIADVAKFVSNINVGANALIKFGRFAEDSLKKIEKGMQEVGGKLTMKVTAPLLGLAYASIKASDPTNRVGKELKELGAQAQNALKPLGDVLIKLFEEATPLLHTAAGAVNVLAKEFSELAPHTQRMIVKGAAIAASLGPALLGLSALATAAKVAASGLNILLASGNSVISMLPALGKGALVAATAFTAFELGTWAHDNLRVVQDFMADFIMKWRGGWETIVSLGKSSLAAIRELMGDFFRNIPQGTFDKIRAGLVMGGGVGAHLAPALGDLSDWAISGGSGGATEVMDKYKAEAARIIAEYQITKAEIDREFGQNQTKGLGLQDKMITDLTGTLTKMDKVWESITGSVKKFTAESDAMGQSLPTTLQTVNSWLADTQGAMDDIAKTWHDWREEAERIRMDTLPEEKIAKAVERLKELQDWFPEIISPEVFAKAAEKIRSEIDKTGAKVKSFGEKVDNAISNFSSDAGRAFADFAVDAQGSLDDLLRSWTKTLIAMAAQQAIFSPIFNSIGNWAGGLFGGATAAAVPGAAPNLPGSAGLGPSALSSRFSIGKSVAAGLGSGADGSGTIVQVIDQRGKGQPVQVSETQGPDGRKMVRVLVRDEVKSMMRDGAFDRVMSDTFGAKRKSYTH